MLVPTQEGTNPFTWEATRIGGAQENPIAKADKRVKSSEQLITKWSPALLQMELDRWLWNDKPHVSLKWVWECLATYLYFPRLRDQNVFMQTIREGIRGRDYFAYATGVNADGRSQGLQIGSAGGSIYLDASSVLVKPEIAFQQIEADKNTPVRKTRTGHQLTPRQQADQAALSRMAQRLLSPPQWKSTQNCRTV